MTEKEKEDFGSGCILTTCFAMVSNAGYILEQLRKAAPADVATKWLELELASVIARISDMSHKLEDKLEQLFKPMCEESK